VKAASKNTSQSPRGKRQKPAKAERAAKLRQHVPFTADSLRDLLRDKVLIAPMVMPADGEIETLVNILNFWQSYYSQLIVDASAYNELLERERRQLSIHWPTSCRSSAQKYALIFTHGATCSGSKLQTGSRRKDSIRSK
jgi:hypothetical protein